MSDKGKTGRTRMNRSHDTDDWDLDLPTPEQVIHRIDRGFDKLVKNMERNVLNAQSWGRSAVRRFEEADLPMTEWNQIRQPNIDIKDLGDAFHIFIELPGVNKEKVDLQVTPDTLVIEAKREGEDKGKRAQDDYITRERSYGKFYRKIPIPEEITPGTSEAVFNDGILKVKLPKENPTPKKKAHRITIK